MQVPAFNTVWQSSQALRGSQWLLVALSRLFALAVTPVPISFLRQKRGRAPVGRGVVLVGILSDVTHVDLSASPATSVNETAGISGQASRSVCGPPADTTSLLHEKANLATILCVRHSA